MSVRFLFLSYRRVDTGGYAGRLADALEERFGKGSVFHDVETIAPGTDFVAAIHAGVDSASVLLLLIGDDWIDARDASGTRLLDREDDFVRIEAARALARGKTILPLLVEGAKMPSLADLPSDLQRLARQQALELSDSRWAYDVDRLVDAIRPYAPVQAPAPARKMRRRMLLALTGLAATVALGGAVYLRRDRPPNLTGRWELPNGSVWTITQDGRRLTIEETHYLSKEIWKRGTGSVDDDAIRVSFSWVFERRAPETGSLKLSADGRMLMGEMRHPDRDRPYPLSVSRRP